MASHVPVPDEKAVTSLSSSHLVPTWDSPAYASNGFLFTERRWRRCLEMPGSHLAPVAPDVSSPNFLIRRCKSSASLSVSWGGGAGGASWCAASSSEDRLALYTHGADSAEGPPCVSGAANLWPSAGVFRQAEKHCKGLVPRAEAGLWWLRRNRRRHLRSHHECVTAGPR